MMLPGFPSEPGHSQSTSMPSKTPAAAPGPPEPSPSTGPGRSPLMNRLTQDETKRLRDSFVRAASEKYFEKVQPPIEISTFRSGWSALSALSCWKLPRREPPQGTATPSTDSSAAHG